MNLDSGFNVLQNGRKEGMPEKIRYFCKGNVLVVPMIPRMEKVNYSIMDKEK